MKNLENIDSELLLNEINRRFIERESTIDAMKDMMLTMETMNASLLKAQKNQSQFMSNIKNEFNNPIFSIISLSKSLAKSSNEEKVQLVASSLHEESLLLNFQVKNISTGAEIESGTLDVEPMKINLEDVLHQLKDELMYPIANKNVTLRVNISYEDDLYLDREKLYLILVNLVSNSIEFSPQNSIVEIDVFEELDDCKIIVKDYGEGIEEEEKEKIFQSFYQAHSGMNRAHRGQGLGLSIVKDLVDFLDGKIKFTSEINKYTMFEINLPKLSGDDSIFADDDFLFDDFGSENKEF